MPKDYYAILGVPGDIFIRVKVKENGRK